MILIANEVIADNLVIGVNFEKYTPLNLNVLSQYTLYVTIPSRSTVYIVILYRYSIKNEIIFSFELPDRLYRFIVDFGSQTNNNDLLKKDGGTKNSMHMQRLTV